MALGAMKERWQHTSSILAMLVNVNRSAKGSVAQPVDFMPEFEPKPRAPVMPISVLRDLFVPPA